MNKESDFLIFLFVFTKDFYMAGYSIFLDKV